MKKFIIQGVALLVVIFLGLAIYTSKITNIPFIPEPTRSAEVVINESRLKVELANTPSKRSKGLGGRESLASDSGMLFIFEKEDRYPFWMKGLKFSLDFIWIKGDQTVDIIKNVPPPQEGQTDESLPLYASKVPIDKVLEVNGGIVDRLNIKIGDIVKIDR